MGRSDEGAFPVDPDDHLRGDHVPRVGRLRLGDPTLPAGADRSLLALVVVRSFFAWLSPNPPKRPWLGWVWLPLTLVPAAVGAFFWLQDHL